MLLAVVLLYVGAVLLVNGLWLIGSAQVAAAGESGTHPLFMQNREVAIINFFTGVLSAILALTLLIYGNTKGDLASMRGGGFILLFAFTYLWVALNQFLNQGGHAFGWYCLFVAITAVPAGIYTLSNAGGKGADVWLGINWFAWAVLWFMFFMLLALDRPIARVTGMVTVVIAIGTAWVLGFLVMIEKLSF